MSKRKAALLGMSHGTAAHQLKKLVLFSLVVECKRDRCFRCGGRILSAKDLSLDHKEPWLRAESPQESFFDLGNIAFSHLECNSLSKSQQTSRLTREGFKGVVKKTDRVRTKSWVAKIFKDNRTRHLGYFPSAKEAAQAYDLEAEKLFGERAVTNKSLGLLD